MCASQQQDPEEHYTAVYQSHSRANRPTSSPDIRKTVNNTAYYTIHFYTVCQAFAFVNVAGATQPSRRRQRGRCYFAFGSSFRAGPLPGPELTVATAVVKAIG